MKLSFFRTPKPRRYNYIPQHFDPKKEELTKRKRALEGQNEDEDAVRYRISSGLKNKYQHEPRKARSGQIRKSNMILIGAIIGLIIMGYFLIENSAIGDWLLGVYGG